MKYLKLFDTENSLQTYMNNNWNSPHIYYAQNNRTTDYEEKYIELEYIRSTQTGGQYIDTGVCLYDGDPINFRIDMNWMLYGHGKTGTQQSTMLCAAQEVSPYQGLNIRTKADSQYWSQCVYKEAQNVNNEWLDDNRYYLYMYDINGTSLSNGKYTTNNTDTRNILQHFDFTFNFSNNQYHNITTSLFCSKDSSGIPWRFIDARLDYLKFYKNNILIRDYIPCIHRGIAGLYDKLHRKFYVSQGDEPFVAGPIKQ